MEKIADKTELIKILIETSSAPREIDRVLEQHAKIKTTEGKVNFLEEMYPDIRIIDKRNEDPIDMIYNLILHAVIMKKYL